MNECKIFEIVLASPPLFAMSAFSAHRQHERKSSSRRRSERATRINPCSKTKCIRQEL